MRNDRQNTNMIAGRTTSKRKRRGWRRILLILLILIGGAEIYQVATESTLFSSALAHVLFTDNLHAVTEGKFYRSGQMSAEKMKSTIAELGLKTVVDLRYGPDDPDPKGRREPDTVHEAGARYVHFPMVGSEVPSKKRVQELVAMLDSVKTPALVHCSSGTHRSGVVSALWILLQQDAEQLKEAKLTPLAARTAAEQLSPKYGFFAFERSIKSWVKGKQTVDRLIWSFLDYNQRTSHGIREFIAQLPDNSAPLGPNSPSSTTR